MRCDYCARRWLSALVVGDAAPRINRGDVPFFPVDVGLPGPPGVPQPANPILNLVQEPGRRSTRR